MRHPVKSRNHEQAAALVTGDRISGLALVRRSARRRLSIVAVDNLLTGKLAISIICARPSLEFQQMISMSAFDCGRWITCSTSPAPPVRGTIPCTESPRLKSGRGAPFTPSMSRASMAPEYFRLFHLGMLTAILAASATGNLLGPCESHRTAFVYDESQKVYRSRDHGLWLITAITRWTPASSASSIPTAPGMQLMTAV